MIQIRKMEFISLLLWLAGLIGTVYCVIHVMGTLTDILKELRKINQREEGRTAGSKQVLKG